MTTETATGQGTTDPATAMTADPASASTQPAQGAADPATQPQGEGQGQQQGNKDGEQKPEDKAGDKPVEYTDFEAPEDVELDQDLLGEFKTFAAGKKLSQEDAQALVSMASRIVQKQHDAYHETQRQWVEAITADKEIGGDKLPESKALVAKTMQAFATPELRQMLQQTGMGNNPELFKFALRIGKAISEDGFVKGQSAAAQPQDPAASFYPSMKK